MNIFPSLQDNPDYTSVINQRHYDRLQGYVEEAKEKGFEVIEIPGKHFCCGSAGSYNILQPMMANELKERRLNSIGRITNSGEICILATDNIGCLMQLASGTDMQVVHTVELLDWATGGLKPPQ